MSSQYNYIFSDGMMSCPKTLGRKAILWATAYEQMSNDERRLVFEAYEYNPKEQAYTLKKVEILTDSVIVKLSEWEDQEIMGGD